MSTNSSLFEPEIETLADGAMLLRGFAMARAAEIMAAIQTIALTAPFRHMETPGGFRMSVAMTNCGRAGWVTDRKGYRYVANDPTTGQAWPAMPELFRELSARSAAQAGYPSFHCDACLINRYEPGARMTLHQDKDEQDFNAPIVSISLGLPAVFLFGGLNRKERPRRVALESGDVVVWGGPSRLFYHGIHPLKEGEHPLTGKFRFNLTFRHAL